MLALEKFVDFALGGRTVINGSCVVFFGSPNVCSSFA